MRELPKPKHKQTILYIVLIALTVLLAAGLRRCATHKLAQDKSSQAVIIGEDSVRYIPVHTLTD